MKRTDDYMQFSLVREMFETPGIIRNFNIGNVQDLVDSIKHSRRLLLTGEGSSRIFPAHNALYSSLRGGLDINLVAEGARQAGEYDLSNFTILASSSSGSTSELIWLFNRFKSIEKKNVFAVTANQDALLHKYAHKSYLLNTGKEEAISSTKIVAAEALFYQEVLARVQGRSLANKFSYTADALEEALELEVNKTIIEKIARAETLYFAGKNDGVAQELALKANEIARKKTNYLEGTYLLHGVEEVMSDKDIIILVNPYASEFKKIKEILVDRIGIEVVVLSDEETMFPTVVIRDVGELQSYVYLALGWNILTEVGLSLGINVDFPTRGRRIRNEFLD